MTENTWATEEEDTTKDTVPITTDDSIRKHAGENVRVLSYGVRAQVVLEESDRETWGMAKWIESSFSDKEGEIVGTWSKSPTDNCYHVFLGTPLEALSDKATQAHLELVKKRQERGGGPPTTKRAQKKVEFEPSVASEALSTIERIRASLKR